MCFSLCACSGNAKVDLDLTKSSTIASSTVTNICNDPNSYKNKVIKVRGKLSGSESYYSLTEIEGCCNWIFEVKFNQVDVPKKGNTVVTGKCVVKKVNGKTSWYLDVTQVN